MFRNTIDFEDVEYFYPRSLSFHFAVRINKYSVILFKAFGEQIELISFIKSKYM